MRTPSTQQPSHNRRPTNQNLRVLYALISLSVLPGPRNPMVREAQQLQTHAAGGGSSPCRPSRRAASVRCSARARPSRAVWRSPASAGDRKPHGDRAERVRAGHAPRHQQRKRAGLPLRGDRVDPEARIEPTIVPAQRHAVQPVDAVGPGRIPLDRQVGDVKERPDVGRIRRLKGSPGAEKRADGNAGNCIGEFHIFAPLLSYKECKRIPLSVSPGS